MKVQVFPTNCGCCGNAVMFTPQLDAPGKFTFSCVIETCRERGIFYELPSMEVKRYVPSALLRPKFGTT
jgi:hypothetical protein